MNSLAKYGIKAVNRVRRRRAAIHQLDSQQQQHGASLQLYAGSTSATKYNDTVVDKSVDSTTESTPALWQSIAGSRPGSQSLYSTDVEKDFLIEDDAPLRRDLSAPLPSRRGTSLNDDSSNEVGKGVLSFEDLIHEMESTETFTQEHGLEALQDLEKLNRTVSLGVPDVLYRMMTLCIGLLTLHLVLSAMQSRFPSMAGRDILTLMRWENHLLERLASCTGWVTLVLIILCLRHLQSLSISLKETQINFSAMVEKIEGHVGVMMTSVPGDVINVEKPPTTPKRKKAGSLYCSPPLSATLIGDRSSIVSSSYSSPRIIANTSLPVSPTFPPLTPSRRSGLPTVTAEYLVEKAGIDSKVIDNIFSSNGSEIRDDFASHISPRLYLQYLRILASPTDPPPRFPWLMDPCCVRFVADMRTKYSIYKMLKSKASTYENETLEEAGLRDSVSLFWPNPISLNMRVNEFGTGIEPATYAFRTPVFEGKILLRCLGFDKHYNKSFDDSLMRDYFARHKRVMQWVVQGTFKRRVPMNSVLTGQLFERSLNLPPALLVRLSMMVIKAFNVIQADDITHPQLPYLVTPLITACQTVVVTDPTREGAEAPDIGSLKPLKDYLGDQGPEFLAYNAKQRRAFFSNLQNLNSYYYEPGLIYTFEAYQHLFRFDTFTFSVGLKQLDIIEYLNKQPLEINCFVDEAYGEALFPKQISDKVKGNIRLRMPAPDQYLWRLQVIHKRMKVAS